MCTGAGAGSGSTGFRRRFRRFRRRCGRLWCSQVRFNRVPEQVPEKVPGGFGAEPGQVQQGSGEGSGAMLQVWEALVQSQARFNRVPEKVLHGEGLGGFGAEPGQVQQGSGEGSGAMLQVWEALVQQVRFNRVPEKVPEKVWEALVQSQVQQGSGEGSGEGSRKPGCKAKSSSTSSGKGSGEGLGGFGAELGRVSERVPEKVWEALVQSGSTGLWRRSGRRFRRRFQEALVQRSRGRFLDSLGQGQVRFNRFNRVSSAWLRSKL